jgi:hypothetical protein
MSACLFVGPTISRDEVLGAGILDIVCLPPVAQGDVYRAIQDRPRAIGIVDGYFEGAAAVWHKEILWAMAEGIHVFGSASMGALRAAELHPLGMRGVGRIFEAYRDGVLEDDDEVAVTHGPAEAGYVALSEPMVNIRATLERAEREGVIGGPARATLQDRAKSRFYQGRSWPALLAEAEGLAAAELDALRAWLPAGRVDQKRADALEMLAAMRDLLAGPCEPMRVDYHFEWTGMWDEAVHVSSSAGLAAGDAAGPLPTEHLLEELRLEPEAWRRARDAAFLRLLALREADRRGLSASSPATGAAMRRFRTERSLFSRQDLERWLADSGLAPAAFEQLLADEARLELLRRLSGRALDAHLLDQLRITGDFSRLAAAARRKRAALARLGLEEPQPEDVGVTPLQVRVWYFEHRLKLPLPDDLGAYVRAAGFASAVDFDRALLREYLYCQAARGSEGH